MRSRHLVTSTGTASRVPPRWPPADLAEQGMFQAVSALDAPARTPSSRAASARGTFPTRDLRWTSMAHELPAEVHAMHLICQRPSPLGLRRAALTRGKLISYLE